MHRDAAVDIFEMFAQSRHTHIVAVR